MCGIFGFVEKKSSTYSKGFRTNSLTALAKFSQSRGKDSSGVCLLRDQDVVEVFKGPIPVKELLKAKELKNSLGSAFSVNTSKWAFGHARLVTNGTQLNNENNQPVIRERIVGVHNGIIVNVEELWNNHKELKRENEIDTEVLLALIRNGLNNHLSVEESVAAAVNDCFGTVATALAFNDVNKFVLSTNNGSLYILTNNKDILFFASEYYILKQFAKSLDNKIGEYSITQLTAQKNLSINLTDFSFNYFSLKDDNANKNISETFCEPKEIKVIPVNNHKAQRPTVMDLNFIHLKNEATFEKSLLEYPIDRIKELKRCTKCLLPETFPFISYDKDGVCNYCNNYTPKNQPKPLNDLLVLVEPYRRKDGKPDILIPFSGGRDSTYVLHTVSQTLGLNPVAYTYDWGMVTDLARRNVSRICGKLGIENIIVAANIHWKRENIRKNITAWLKQPELGMIPLFMAGDKFFFYYAHKIKKQLGIDLEIWGVNELENTNFKTGFAGLRPEFEKERIYSLSLKNKLKLFSFVGRNVIKSPGYINQSVLDSLGSFASRYFTTKAGYYHLFDYMKWDEKHIEKTIMDNYNWETAVDTNSTWRIGDGTASFYNYIYTRVAGFSENDTFRSNQIREGMISREEALEKIYEENKPRYNSLKWYLEIIGMDYEDTIRKINSIPQIF